MDSRRSMLSLYKNLIKFGKAFPSIKRKQLVNEIRASFKKNRFESDPAKIEMELGRARKGLSQLMQYTNLSKNGTRN